MVVFLTLKMQRAFSGEETQGGLWNYIQLFFIALAGLYPLYSGRGGSNIVLAKPLLWLALFTFLVFMYTFFRMNNVTIETAYALIMTLYPLAVSVIFFFIGYRVDIAQKTALYYGYYLAAFVLILSLYRFFRSGYSWSQRGSVADVYYVLGLLPLMMAYVRGKKAIVPIMVCAIAIAFSGKRAGMIAMFLMIGVYYFVQNAPSVTDIRRILRTVLGVGITFLIIIALGIYLDNQLHLRITERLSNMVADGGSGRVSRWSYVVRTIPNSTLSELLFGRAYDNMVEAIEGHAHNDFLEILYVYGLFGFVLYVLFFFSCLRVAIRMSRQRYEYAQHFATTLVCSFVVANFSVFFILPSYTTSGMLCLGIFLGHYVRTQVESSPGRRRLSRHQVYDYQTGALR